MAATRGDAAETGTKGGGGGGSYFDPSVTNTSAMGGTQMGNGSVSVTLVTASPVQNPAASGVEDGFQLSYISQLNNADTVINISNAGTSAGTGTI